jgi:hypothetical protein
LDGTKPSFIERRRIHTTDNHHHGPSTPSAAIVDNNIPPTITTKWPTAAFHNTEAVDDVANVMSQPTSPTIAKTKKLARTKSKGNKRIIKLGGSSQVIKDEPPIAEAEDDKNNVKYVHRLAELEEAVQQEQVLARRAASVRSRRSNKKASKEEKAAAALAAAGIESITDDTESTKRNSEAFRRKIEAMRREAGTEWLRVLQEMDVVKAKTPPATTTTE